MPTYDYHSEETGETREVFHGINEEPEILDSKGNPMKRIITLGHGGYKITKGSTRNIRMRDRYGRRSEYDSSTPAESAAKKAEESKQEKINKKDPYAQWR